MEKTLLMVEHDTFLALIYARAFEHAGFTVRLAGSGEEGIRLAKRDKPAAILFDLLLPGMDGFEMLEALRADAEVADVPAVVLSDLGQREDVDRAASLGVAGYLIKTHTLPADAVRKIKTII